METKINSKTIEYEGKIYNCKFQIIEEESIDISIFLLNSLIFKGNITLEKIKMQIFYFSQSNINEIYEEIIQLDFDNFSIIKENDKYKLKIKLIFMKKEKYLLIDLIENKDKNLINNDIINYYENIIKEKNKTISELREIIKFKDEKNKALKEQLKNKDNEKKFKEKYENDLKNIRNELKDILNKKFEEIQINLDSLKNELKTKREKEKKEGMQKEKEEEERKKREKEKEEEERKKREKEKEEEERKKREKEKEEEERKRRVKEKEEVEDDDNYNLNIFKDIEDNIKKNNKEEFIKNNNNYYNSASFLNNHSKNKFKREYLYYSYECTNNNNLTAYINEKTETAKINVTLKNDGTLDWPENNIKLIFDKKFKVKGEDIILKPQEKGTELDYEIIFNNLDKLSEGEYQSYAIISIKGEQFGEKLKFKIKIKKKVDTNKEMNKNIDKINSFREYFNLDEIKYPNEIIFNALKEKNYKFEETFCLLCGDN